MRKLLGIFAAIITAVSMFSSPSFAAKSETIIAPIYQAQYQWRGVSPINDWTPSFSYQNLITSMDFVVTGIKMHINWGYSRAESDFTGQSTVYEYDNDLDLWIGREGTVSYVYEYGYGKYPATNYFRGYLEFDGEPGEDNFVHGVAYQWSYLYAPYDAELEGAYTDEAVWDATMDAWLVGFFIYVWDSNAQNLGRGVPFVPYQTFPDPMIKPVPADDYNPLDL